MATTALVGAGARLSNAPFDGKLLFTIYLANLGTWFLYGFDFRKPFKPGWQRLFIAQILIAFGFSIVFLSEIQFLVLGFIFVLGLLYQAEIPLISKGFQLKKLLLFKNVLIGISWAALVLLGANDLSSPAPQFMFWFVTIQVGFGSIIRDLNDVEHDRQNGLNTVPLYLGITKTLVWLHLINLLSILIVFAYEGMVALSWMLQLAIVVVLYKALLLWQVQRNQQKQIWTQYLNILTCLLIFILTCLLY